MNLATRAITAKGFPARPAQVGVTYGKQSHTQKHTRPRARARTNTHTREHTNTLSAKDYYRRDGGGEDATDPFTGDGDTCTACPEGAKCNADGFTLVKMPVVPGNPNLRPNTFLNAIQTQHFETLKTISRLLSIQPGFRIRLRLRRVQASKELSGHGKRHQWRE